MLLFNMATILFEYSSAIYTPDREAPNQYVSVGAIYFPNVMDLYMYGYMAQKMVRTVDILYLDVRTDLWTIATTSR
jgi:hypothetical protein